MTEALRKGVTVLPEGTTGANQQVLPFSANLLPASIATGTPVKSVVKR